MGDYNGDLRGYQDTRLAHRKRTQTGSDTIYVPVLAVGDHGADSSHGTATLTTTNSTSTIASAGAGLRTYLTTIVISNTSATDTRVDILDGATVKFSVLAAASGGGCALTLPVPIRGSAATAWNSQLGTAVTDVRVTLVGYSAP